MAAEWLRYSLAVDAADADADCNCNWRPRLARSAALSHNSKQLKLEASKQSTPAADTSGRVSLRASARHLIARNTNRQLKRPQQQ